MLSVARRRLRSTTRHLLCLLRFTVSTRVAADRLFLRLALRSGRETLCSEVSGLEPPPGQYEGSWTASDAYCRSFRFPSASTFSALEV